MVLVKFHVQNETKVWANENVHDPDNTIADYIRQKGGHLWRIDTLACNPADTGFSCVARARMLTVMTHKVGVNQLKAQQVFITNEGFSGRVN